MAWNEKRILWKRKEQDTETQRREELRRKALKESNYEVEEPKDTCQKQRKRDPKQKKTNPIEEAHLENEKRREERRKEIEEIEQRKKQKTEERKEWSAKFKLRTKKGQIPLEHRINYALKKIEQTK